MCLHCRAVPRLEFDLDHPQRQQGEALQVSEELLVQRQRTEKIFAPSQLFTFGQDATISNNQM